MSDPTSDPSPAADAAGPSRPAAGRGRWWLLAGLVLAVGVFFALDLGRFLDLGELKARQAQFEALRDAHPVATLTVFAAVYVVTTALSLPGATLLTLAGGAIFGFWTGLVVVSFASSLGATLAFLTARHLLRDTVQARFGQRLAEIDRGIARDGALYLFTLRLVPLVPFFVLNLAMGLTAMKVRTFYAVSQLGMLAATAVYVNAGTQLARLESLQGILSPTLLASFALLGVFPWFARLVAERVRVRRLQARWRDRRPRRFDRNLVVIGGGSAGLVTAYIAAAVKAEVTLVERDRLGGDCLNTGCVPSKALIRAAAAAQAVRRARDFGIDAAAPEVDFASVMDRVQAVIRAIEPHDSVERYTGLGVDVVLGEAVIVDPWHVRIARRDGGQQLLSTRSIVIATGAGPAVPDIPGLATVDFLTSDTVWNLRERPARLVVLGGGPIGCELAQAFARLGSRVTLVEAGARLLAREDDDVSAAVAQALAADGVDVRTGHSARACRPAGALDYRARAGVLTVAPADGEEAHLPFDALLVAVGRRARLRGFGLEDLGIPVGATVEVDEMLRTVHPNILAAGDVAGPWQLTHAASHQAWYAAVNALFGRFRRFRVDRRVMPACTFVDPEVARVGLNVREARERGIAHEVTRYDLDDLDRAIADGCTRGWVQVLTEPGRDRILGATVVGHRAGELLPTFALAMKHGLGLSAILGTVHAYPTMAEAAKYAAGSWKRAHAPQRLLGWVRRYHAWERGGGGGR